MAVALAFDGEEWLPRELAWLVRAARALARSAHSVASADGLPVRVFDVMPDHWTRLEAPSAAHDRREADASSLTGRPPAGGGV
jgi:hypothetical protein